MAVNRYYSSVAGAPTLTGSINTGVTACAVTSVSGFPNSTPYTLVIDPGLASEEIVTVTGVAGTTLTITRGEDGSSAQSHSLGATVRHMATARDLREPQEHIAASENIHGVGSGNAVVGSGTTQTLTNKTMSGASNAFSNIPSSAITGLDAALSEATAHSSATAAHGATGAVVGTTNTQTLTNKTISGASNTLSDIPSSAVTGLDTHTAATAAHGATGAVVGTTNTQTLTNKTISGASNTLSGIAQASVTNLTTDLSSLDSRLDTAETEIDALQAMIRGGVASVSLNGSGDGSITIASSGFPNNLVSVALTDATDPASLGAIILKYTASTSSKTTITFRAYDSGGTALASQTVAVSYVAYGN